MSNETLQTTADFLRVLRASNLAKREAIDPVVAPWADHTGPLSEELVAAVTEAGLVTPWHVEQLRKGRYKGFFLGKYKLLRLLGSGGMSSVYLAEHATLQNEVAIKVLPLKRVEQTSFLARFEREARMSARLNHPNITRAFDLDTAGSIHFFVMEYVEGIDLHKKVKQEGPLPMHEAADLIRQAALGLHYAHEEGFVHRDIKPANMILDRRGTLKILDLGLGLSGADDSEAASLTQEFDEKVLGTADFLAPEQVTDSHNVDKRADIYSLGCTLYYLLTGVGPFAEGSVKERFRKHLQATPPNLLEKRPDTPPAIAALYLRMLQKRPEARQQTAKEVADTLAAWLAENPATAPDAAEPAASTGSILREQLRRRSADPSRGGSAHLRNLAPPRLPARSPAGSPGRPADSDIGSSRVGPASGISGIDSSQLSFATPPPSSGLESTIKPKPGGGRSAGAATSKTGGVANQAGVGRPAAGSKPGGAAVAGGGIRAGGPSKSPPVGTANRETSGELPTFDAAPAANSKTGRSKAATSAAGEPLSAADQAKAYRLKKKRGQFAGLPVIAWVMIGVGGLIAGGLAVYAWQVLRGP